MPKVSVCLPVYNGAEFLPQAIESILKQTFTDFELLIADDCSTDESWEIIQRYASADTRICAWKNERNLGLFGNWNLTMREARGEYIKPFAQDDFCKPLFFERLVRALDENPGVAIAGSARQFFNGEKAYAVEPDARVYYRDRIFDGKDVCLKFLLEGNNLIGFPPAILFRREHLGPGFDERYFHCGDVEFFMRLLKNGSYYFIYKPLVTYRYHGQNQTYKNFAELKFMSDLLLLRHEYAGFVAECGVSNFGEINADQLADVVAVGRRLLGIDYSQVEQAPVLDNRSAVEIIIALADRISQLKAQLPAEKDVGGAHVEQLLAERDQLVEANRQLHRQLHELLNSTSWRLTKPIRSVKRMVARSWSRHRNDK